MQFSEDGAQLVCDSHWLGGYAQLMMSMALLDVSWDLSKDVLVLDIGCGNGSKTEALRRMGVKTLGLERDKNRLVGASERFSKVQYCCADGSVLPIQSGKFDMVFSFSVFQYLNWQKTVQECYRVLKPGGVAIFIENLSGSPLAKAYRLAHRLRKWHHLDYQTPVRHLQWQEIANIQKVFPRVNVEPFHLLTPLLLVHPILKYRLLKQLPTSPPKQKLEQLHLWDRKLLRLFPKLSRFCWNVVIRAQR